jgi:endonuclease YncB( thermonuclease family)
LISGQRVGAIRIVRTCASALALGAVLLATGAGAEAPCNLTMIGTATVRAVADGDIMTEDGRTIRLAAIHDASATEIRALLAPGRTIVLKRIPGAPETDRYGRVVAHVVLDEAGTWLQADLVRRGLARTSSRVGDPGCAKQLQEQENSARSAKLGLWGEAYYVNTEAAKPADILKQRGRFALVEGRVISVRESGGTIYVNFGRRWSEDFTVTIAKRNERTFVAAGLAPKTLGGRQVRIRGWIEERGGPWVEASRPEQIEVLTRN